MRLKLKQYYEMKQKTNLSIKLNLYFSMLQNTLASNLKNLPFFFTKKYQQPIAQIFLKCFQEEKVSYLYEMMSFIKNKSDSQNGFNFKQNEDSFKSIQTVQELITTIQTSAQIEQTVMKLPYWYQVHFKFNKTQRYLDIISKKRNFRLFLSQYLIRKSHNVDYCIVFQALKDQAQENLKVFHFSFGKQIFQKIWEQLFNCVIKCRNQELLLFLNQAQAQDQIKINKNLEEKKKDEINQCQNKSLVFLNSKSTRTFQKFKQNTIKHLNLIKNDFQSILTQQLLSHPFITNFKIEQYSKTENIFRMEILFKKSSNEVKHQFIQAYKQKFKYLILRSILQEENDKYKAVYERLLFKENKIHQAITIQEEGSLQQEVIFIKGVQHIINKDYIQFIFVKIEKINEVQSKLIITGSFNLDKFFNVDLVIRYLLEIKDMIFKQKRKISIYQQVNNQNIFSDDDFYTVCEGQMQYQDVQMEEGQSLSFQSIEQQKQENIIQQNEQKQQKQIFKNNSIQQERKLKKKSSKKQQKLTINQNGHELNYLNTRHKVKPSEHSNVFMKEHYLYKDWTRVKRGGVACYNQQIINQQKKLFKKVITKMGSSLLKGNGIINLSLPVDIFKKQSQLTSIAKDFCFAPTFIEKAINCNNSLEKIKYATLLAISVGNLGVSMEKPFNPIIGETLQGFIDNCPIYLQQISHHPPISAYYLAGRGYSISGQIQTKISVGMNTVKGYSQKPNHINFKDGTKMTMVYGKMLIKGMLFGQRQFTFQDKIFVYDETNNLFSEIIYGPRKKSKDPEDYIYGKIHQLKKSFKNKFYMNRQNFYPNSEDIERQLSCFEGVWTESIKFDGKQYVNFVTQLPYDFEQEKYPLLSNSSYRMDLRKLIQNKVEQAQKWKQEMEQSQRKDRKLRQKYTKKS